MPIELGFILHAARRDGRGRRVAARAPAVEGRPREGLRLARRRSITKHYHGDDTDVKVLMGGILQAFAGQTVEEYAAAADAFLRGGKHPTLGRRFHECGYVPMVELLRYLEANGFTNYIASGGDRDFMRPVTERDVRHPVRARDRQLERARLHRRRARRQRRLPGRAGRASTTARSSRCGSGAASASARSSPAATPTATSRCCATPAARTVPRSACSCCTTTTSASSPTPPAPRSSLEQAAERGLDGGQHQERLGDGVQRLSSAEPGAASAT